ncbi:MAG: hypothetical protein IPM98_09490 [Lewinellaceae bacterium]|nr:hypothetical protein [Lewinellaceae bacterium]
MTKALKFFLLPAFALVALLFSCTKTDELTVDEAVDQALYGVQERGGMGRYGCYELVFPVAIELPNGTTVEADSYDAIKQQLRTYFEANSDSRRLRRGVRPHLNFVFPISVVSEDGDLIAVESEETLQRLRAECAGTFGSHDPRGHGQHGLSCFEVVFPITIEFPDGTTAEAGDRQAVHQLLRVWMQNNPGVPARPKVTFPLTVKMADDGSLVTVDSPEALRRLKADCR